MSELTYTALIDVRPKNIIKRLKGGRLSSAGLRLLPGPAGVPPPSKQQLNQCRSPRHRLTCQVFLCLLRIVITFLLLNISAEGRQDDYLGRAGTLHPGLIGIKSSQHLKKKSYPGWEKGAVLVWAEIVVRAFQGIRQLLFVFPESTNIDRSFYQTASYAEVGTQEC